MPTSTVTASTSCRASTAEEALLAELRRTEPASFGAMFLDRVSRTPDAEAYRRPDSQGAWRSQSWAETGTAVTEIAAGLLGLGLRAQERVAILAGTRTAWIEADFGVMCAGGATTTVYPSSSAAEVTHILTDSASRFAVVEHAGQLAKVFAAGSPVEYAVLIDGAPDDGDTRVLTLGDLRARGRELLAAEPAVVREACAAIRAGDLATLIYTSGTTGLPKGVRVTHHSWIYQGLAIQAMGFLDPDDLGYLWLPLAHAFGKALLSCQLSVGFAFAVDGDVGRLVERLPVVRPTIIPAVPRIFEKVYAGVLATVQNGNPATARLFTWGIGVGLRVSRLRRQGERPGRVLAVQHRIADRLVLARIRSRFGGRLRFFISGAAALSTEIGEWFDAVGLPVLEGYGLTETCATTFFNRPGSPEYGTVGLPLPGTAVALAEDGEILVRGPGVMQGYHDAPGATAETLAGGWLHTGDIGEITAAGSLRITDRKKDLIKTSNGKYVAPQTIEARFKGICPLASQIVVHGDGRKYITALIDLDPDAVRGWAARHGLGGADYARITRSPQLTEAVGGYVEQLNATLAPWETIKKFLVLDHHLAVEGGDLTPSLKVRRRAVETRYAGLLDSLYPAGSPNQ
ncbi:AMP-dependent synthetase/ligase [Actinoplanes auranticolor]|uniref:AMP-dependent synthetase n=1 Tax=Actinoplanes auranticolor TaxID=47988 RepID=A0A919VIG4_9ACTN|nr:long-chain fatty acid--CoA ligase [Actinoplanes auranticolor]GIM63815.1 AMP-dependent synthetase [Actinoplanes auranticolor]